MEINDTGHDLPWSPQKKLFKKVAECRLHVTHIQYTLGVEQLLIF